MWQKRKKRVNKNNKNKINGKELTKNELSRVQSKIDLKGEGKT